MHWRASWPSLSGGEFTNKTMRPKAVTWSRDSYSMMTEGFSDKNRCRESRRHHCGCCLAGLLAAAYRQLHITVSSILIAIGTGLFVTVLIAQTKLTVLLSWLALVLFAGIAAYVLPKMRNVVSARGHDVNWWHSLAIQHEQLLSPEERYFTKFKIHQQLRRANAEELSATYLSPSPRELTEEQIGKLVGRGLGHTRWVFDVWLFRATFVVWGCFVIGGGLFTWYSWHQN